MSHFKIDLNVSVICKSIKMEISIKGNQNTYKRGKQNTHKGNNKNIHKKDNENPTKGTTKAKQKHKT